ncbi:hypothetical protein [Herpetosiphon geysericola]|uniref:Uncharacterized protein n=1 Tax=Herpetosiphon geysericola TaxID=70996 RepID=A0A0P6YGG5_9CHLR|nr:hypothetical protein [Herpetosiphon geysericola]KPL91308.1 hypothetical protein SE18_02455 [Herpetosiphon geysericola]
MNGSQLFLTALILAGNVLWWLRGVRASENWFFGQWLSQRWQVEIRRSERFKGKTWEIHPNDAAKLSTGKRASFQVLQSIFPLITAIPTILSIFLITWVVAMFGQ